MLIAAAEFRKRVITGTLPTEKIGRKEPKTPLCSAAFKYMFNACRVPHRIQDSYRMYDPSLHTHCIVARHGKFYAVDFVDGDTGDALPLEVLEERLKLCVRLAEEENSVGVDLGWLTSNDRDSWADARKKLLDVGGVKMEQALERLESGALLLCLDDEEPVSRKQCGEIFWHGGNSSSHNRWFDKSIQIFCTNNGKAGLLGEHSMIDGMPMIGLADHIVRTSYSDALTRAPMSGSGSDFASANNGVESIFGECSKIIDAKGITRVVADAKQSMTKLITDHELHVQSFQGYGSDQIKKMGYSPDAFVQMAIQLATYRLFQKQAATYESSQARVFLHGRTETTRSVSPASSAFVKRMGLTPSNRGNEAINTEKIGLLQQAVSSHVTYIGQAAKGLGVDRHFFGLSLLSSPNDKQPDLYSHPAFQRSKTWRVSTSHLTHPRFDNWGFGEVVPDGVGIGYAVKKTYCMFNVTARKEHGFTEKLSHLLEEALLEMKELHSGSEQAVNAQQHPQSKL